MNSDITTIWTTFQAELKRFILNKTRNKADTDDILQEVFIKIIKQIDKVNEAENLKKYLYGIVRNAVNDYFRNRQLSLGESDVPFELTEAEAQSLNETIADCCIHPFIKQLPEKYREALVLSDLGDISQKDLAEKLNISYSGAKSRVQRGREKLKALILNCCAYESDRYGNLMEPDAKGCGCET